MASSAASSDSPTNGCGRRTIQRSSRSSPAANPTVTAAKIAIVPQLGGGPLGP